MALLLASLGAGALSGCGGGTRQDASEPNGKFPVSIVKAELPNRERLANSVDLTLSVGNIGDETMPNLAITMYTDRRADDSFSVHSDQPGLAIPSRPVWVLEETYPRLLGESTSAGAETALGKTYAFGAVDPGETRAMVWRLTPVMTGSFTLHYRIDAGLEGNAVAETADGSVPEGEFAVTITGRVPRLKVTASGKIVAVGPGAGAGEGGGTKQQQRAKAAGGN